MRILKLVVENYKKLRAVEITPQGEMVVITGRNGQGKTSVLDSIWDALKHAEHIQTMPIRIGANKARIHLDLGELIVERHFTPKGSTLTVEKADGARYTSPQSILDALLGALTFDPLAFVNEEPREQFDTLRMIVPLEVDVDELDELTKRDFDARTDLNRRAKQLRAQAEGITVPDKLPAEPIDTGALKTQMTAAATTNAEIEKERGERAQAATRIVETVRAAGADTARAVELRQRAADLDAEAAKLRDSAADMDATVEQTLEKMGNLREDLDALPPLAKPINADALRAELDSGESLNRSLEQYNRKRSILSDAEKLERQAHELTAMMETRAIVKDEAIKKAPMPVPGLSFGDGVVTFEGVPFGQASSSEQLDVSVEIAMAANPTLRVIRIKEGSLLDDANLARLAAKAKEKGYQVWIERVDTSGKVGVVIEDGMVVAVDGEPVSQSGEKS